MKKVQLTVIKVIKMSTFGNDGCDIQKYVLPYGKVKKAA